MTLSTNTEKAAHWKQILDDWKLSTLNQKEFCKVKEISFATFGYWRKKFNRDEAKISPKIIPVVIRENTIEKPTNSIAFNVHFKCGASIEIPLSMNDQAISRILNLAKNLL